MTIKLTFCLTMLTLGAVAQETKLIRNDVSDCGLSNYSIQLAQMIIEFSGQLRKELVCNKELARVANIKARLLAKADKITHDIDNITPNELLQSQGIELPFAYQNLGNQVEAILGGMETPQESFDYFMTSPDHKAHILGENNFYQKQNQIGVGYYLDENTKYEEYWVVYITALRTVGEAFDTNLKLKTKVVFEPSKDVLQTSTIDSFDKKTPSHIKQRVSKTKK